MKKIILMFAVMLGFAVNASAQASVGVTANMGTGDSFTNYGIGVRGQYGFTENWRGEVSFDYFLKKDNLSMWNLNADVQYVFKLNDAGMGVYPLAGVTLHNSKVSYSGYSASDSNFGFNYGVGFEAPVADNIKVLLEGRGITVDGGTRWQLQFGVAYSF